MFMCFKADPKKSTREYKIHDPNIRTNFQRDRDRILYSKSFRRLSGKTQVFVAGYDDHMRTRLTHTLEVAQIAKTISFALGLDIDLTEAIAFGHDLGHTPFGHVGERTLNYIMNGCDKIREIEINNDKKGFKHNLQGITVVKDLECLSLDYSGLNLTKECMWGIQSHTKMKYSQCENLIKKKTPFDEHSCKQFKGNCYCEGCNILYTTYYDKIVIDDKYFSFEAMVVKMADDIAQRHHDIEDGMLV